MGDNDKRIHESLSALMDGEASEMETLRLLRGMEQGPELRETWQRYHLAAAALRRDLPPRMTDLSSRISAAIDAEEAPSRTFNFNRVLQPLSKVAVAATVAVVAVLGVRQFQLLPEAPALLATAPEVTAPESEGTTGPQFQLPAGFDFPPVSGRMASTGSHTSGEPRSVTIMQQVQPDLETQREIQIYLNAMMKRHTENASSQGGLSPSLRLQDGKQ